MIDRIKIEQRSAQEIFIQIFLDSNSNWDIIIELLYDEFD